MPDQNLRLEIRGLRETQDKMEQMARDLSGDAMLRGMRDATLIVERDAKKNVPVDTGRLRASITPEVQWQSKTLRGVVGTNVFYGPYVETGTRPHWPPRGALSVWARRHGMSEGVVRYSISKFGTSRQALKKVGTKGWRYLERAFTENIPKIVKLIGDVVGRIVKK
jgi:HK97 gp10 family phage protein